MSKTDKTRPWWVQEKDPLNQRFRMVGIIHKAFNPETGEYELYEWFWKPMFAKHQCWCCSQKHAFFFEDGRGRVQWRHERQKLLKEWRWDQEGTEFYDHWSTDDSAEYENNEGLRFVDFYGTYKSES